ncbi:MAG: helix-turn-helix transcriptional regulator [Magnetococcales bacterium]|nr:helix-turn-helix transcriptional regulator [Magnetococcales bacterium]
MSVIQFIENNGRKEYAILPYPLFERLATLIEEVEDLQAVEAFHDRDDGFRIPEAILRCELAGESPIKLWREHRGLTPAQLAEQSDVALVVLERIEAQAIVVPPETLDRLSRALHVPADVLRS